MCGGVFKGDGVRWPHGRLRATHLYINRDAELDNCSVTEEFWRFIRQRSFV